MSEFSRVAAAIMSKIKERQRIHHNQIPRIVGADHAGYESNCYPGFAHGKCEPVVFVVSLWSREYRYGRKHLNLERALETLIQHCKRCPNTKVAVLLTDSWDPNVVNRFNSQLRVIADSLHLEIHLLAGERPVEIHFI